MSFTPLQQAVRWAGIAELATGAALIAAPMFVLRLLVGEQGGSMPPVLARFVGVALVGLGVSCWRTPATGMLLYSTLAALLLGTGGASGGWNGAFLGPAVVIHVLISVGLAWLLLRERSPAARS